MDRIQFGREYLIPKPVDHRVLLWEAVAVAKAAWKRAWRASRLRTSTPIAIRWKRGSVRGGDPPLLHQQRQRATPKRIVFSEGENQKIMRAAGMIVAEGIGTPILVGHEGSILKRKEQLGLQGCEIFDPEQMSPEDVADWVDEVISTVSATASPSMRRASCCGITTTWRR